MEGQEWFRIAISCFPILKVIPVTSRPRQGWDSTPLTGAAHGPTGLCAKSLLIMGFEQAQHLADAAPWVDKFEQAVGCFCALGHVVGIHPTMLWFGKGLT